ncbi:MAG: hypothetical protein J1F24_06775 [Oscillospiraceae bacterium]|nr:hypothetical protein [Oscillospiraceae bacterium]
MSDKKSLNEKYGRFEPDGAVADELEEDSFKENIKKSKKAKKEKKAKTSKKAKKKEQELNKQRLVDAFWEEERETTEEIPPIEPEINSETESEDAFVPDIDAVEADELEENIKKAKKGKKEKKVKEPKEKKKDKKKKDKKKKETEMPIEAEELAEREVPEQTEEPDFEIAEEEVVSDEAVPEETVSVKQGRQREEIIFENVKGADENPKVQKHKKEKPAKTPKEKKVKEPKEKKVKEPKEPKEKTPRDPLEKKDVATIAVSVVALLLVLCVGSFAFFNTRSDEKKIQIVSKSSFLAKLFPEYAVNPNDGNSGDEKSKLSGIQIVRDGLYSNLMQTDFPGVFYGINSDYSVQYYQYSDSRLVPVKYTDTVDLKVDMGSGILNVKMNYIKKGEYVSGVSVFTSNGDDNSNYFYNLVVFKLTVLPSKYNRDGHALLLASTDKSALENSDILWTESFDVNLNDGSMTRFLSVVNRSIDEKGAGVADFCMLNRAGYTAASQTIPFITSREYPVGSGLQDIFVKNGNKEGVLASNIYGKYLTVDGGAVVYLRRTTTGFDVVHNTDGEEKNVRSFYGFMDTNYMINDKYLLSKDDGHLYNIVADKDYTLVGYSMNVTSFAVSSDNRYVVMMGTVKNAVDYQIHIFDLQTGEYAKFKDNNYAPHSSLCFIDDKTVLYTAVEPNQGYEYVILDASKAFNK